MICPLALTEKEAILRALMEIGHPLGAARELGIGKTTIYRKLKEYGLPLKATVSEIAIALADTQREQTLCKSL